jgi:hypothetical protein
MIGHRMKGSSGLERQIIPPLALCVPIFAGSQPSGLDADNKTELSLSGW